MKERKARRKKVKLGSKENKAEKTKKVEKNRSPKCAKANMNTTTTSS